MDNVIGTTAGNVWVYLSNHGETSLIKLKAALGISNSQLHLALGWLAREGKIAMAEYGHTFKVSLKSESPL